MNFSQSNQALRTTFMRRAIDDVLSPDGRRVALASESYD